jgi:hypothetical protein
MMINLFMPLILIMTLQYFIFFSEETEKIEKIKSSAKLLLAALAYLRVFRASIPVNPRLSLGDSYAISVLLAILWTVIDAFAFPKEEGVDYSESTEIAHYTLIGIVSLYPAWVLLRTLSLYRRYMQLAKRVKAESQSQQKN